MSLSRRGGVGGHLRRIRPSPPPRSWPRLPGLAAPPSVDVRPLPRHVTHARGCLEKGWCVSCSVLSLCGLARYIARPYIEIPALHGCTQSKVAPIRSQARPTFIVMLHSLRVYPRLHLPSPHALRNDDDKPKNMPVRVRLRRNLGSGSRITRWHSRAHRSRPGKSCGAKRCYARFSEFGESIYCCSSRAFRLLSWRMSFCVVYHGTLFC